MNVLIEDKELNVNGQTYFVDFTVYGSQVDGSFSHAFGIESRKEIEADEIEIETIYNHEGDVIINRDIEKAIEKMLDPVDYVEELANQ